MEIEALGVLIGFFQLCAILGLATITTVIVYVAGAGVHERHRRRARRRLPRRRP
jgi:hypothetical protein